MQHNKPTFGRRPQRQRGASMIEVLVSILIFAFGMLGMVGLQTRTLGYGQMSLYRSQAAALTDDILDRMRADLTNAKGTAWVTAVGDAASSFTGTSVAQKDLNDWKGQVETLLPSGQASIAVASGVVTVTVQWKERDTANTTFTTTSGL